MNGLLSAKLDVATTAASIDIFLAVLAMEYIAREYLWAYSCYLNDLAALNDFLFRGHDYLTQTCVSC
jgi:hypothetical protein